MFRTKDRALGSGVTGRQPRTASRLRLDINVACSPPQVLVWAWSSNVLSRLRLRHPYGTCRLRGNPGDLALYLPATSADANLSVVSHLAPLPHHILPVLKIYSLQRYLSEIEIMGVMMSLRNAGKPASPTFVPATHVPATSTPLALALAHEKQSHPFLTFIDVRLDNSLCCNLC